MARPAGYSGTPLARKLGIGEGTRVGLVDPPAGLADLLGPLPAGARLTAGTKRAELIIAFSKERRRLERRLTRLLAALPSDGALWVAWPKRASKVPTDMGEDVARQLLLPLGWVDVKVCAIDETWSGLKFVLRKELR